MVTEFVETVPAQELKRRVETPVFHGGRLLHPDVASTAELLAIAEGEDHK